MTASPIPDLPVGFDTAWLTALLQDSGTLPASNRVAEVTRTQVGDGTGMMSELSRLEVTYAEPHTALPASFIAKYASQNATNREVAMSFNLYERETRYFAELDPRTEAVTPEIYVSRVEGDRFIILMQDMGDYRVGDQAVGADLAETEVAVDELAKLHGAFWNQVQDIDWVPHIARSYHADNMYNFTAAGWGNMCQLFGDFLSPAIAARGEQFHGALRGLQTVMDTPPITLIHGDFRMENLMFGTAPAHAGVAILDWQGPLLGCGLVDVALMLAQSTRTDVRRSHERALIERYVAGLAAVGVSGYDSDTAWHHYRQALLYNWCYVAVVAGTLDASNERAFRWMSQMVARQSAASEDLDVFDQLPA